jgi:hypothetical protein
MNTHKIWYWETIILLVDFNGFEVWSHTQKGENRPRVFERRVLRTIFGPKGKK